MPIAFFFKQFFYRFVVSPGSIIYSPYHQIPVFPFSPVIELLTPLLIHDTHPYGTYLSPLLKPFA